MKCAIDKTGQTHPGTATVARRVYQQAQGASGPDREVEILRYAA